MNADPSLPHHRANCLLADAQRRLAEGDPRAALALARQARDTAAPLHEPALEGAALELAARCAYLLGALDEALPLSHQAAECWSATGDTARQAAAAAMQSLLLTHLGRAEEGMHWAQRAHALAERCAEPAARAWAACAVALGHRLAGHLDAALAEMRAAVALAATSGDEELHGRCLNNLAQMLFHQGQALYAEGQADSARQCHEQALQHRLQALDGFHRLGHQYFIGLTQANLGDDYFQLGRLDEAEALARQSLATARERGSGMHESHALLALGQLQVARGALHEARATLTRAAEVADAAQHHDFAKTARLRLSEVCERLGDLAAALAQHKAYHAEYARTASEAALVRARALAVHFETERAKASAAHERLRAEHLARRNAALAREAEQLSRDVLLDALTGLANRRRLDQVLARHAAARDTGFTLALLDIDHFKQVNDRYSHLVGDQVLQRIGALLRDACRRGDLAARFGGEEFALLLGGADPGEARQACERLRAAIEHEPWSAIAPGLWLTASIGFAAGREAGDTAALLALADQRLYAAKAAGRNRVAP